MTSAYRTRTLAHFVHRPQEGKKKMYTNIQTNNNNNANATTTTTTISSIAVSLVLPSLLAASI